MQKISQWDRFVGAHFPWFVLGCVVLGLTFPDVFSPLNGIMVPLFAFMTFANSLGGGFRELGHVILHPLPVLVTVGLLHVLLPLAAMGLGNLLFPDAPLFTIGLVLEYAIPTAVSSLMWIGLCRGNAMLGLSIVLLDTLISPVVIPLSLKLLVGSVVEMDTMGMMGDMMVMVAIPAVIGMSLYQATKGKIAVTLKPRLEFPSKLALLLMITVNSTGCADFLRNMDMTLILVMLATILLCLIGFLAGYWAGKLLKMDFPTCETMCLNTGLRNISAGAVLAMEYFPADVLFPVAFTPLFLQFTTAMIAKVLRKTPAGKAYFAQTEEIQAS